MPAETDRPIHAAAVGDRERGISSSAARMASRRVDLRSRKENWECSEARQRPGSRVAFTKSRRSSFIDPLDDHWSRSRSWYTHKAPLPTTPSSTPDNQRFHPRFDLPAAIGSRGPPNGAYMKRASRHRHRDLDHAETTASGSREALRGEWGDDAGRGCGPRPRQTFLQPARKPRPLSPFPSPPATPAAAACPPPPTPAARSTAP